MGARLSRRAGTITCDGRSVSPPSARRPCQIMQQSASRAEIPLARRDPRSTRKQARLFVPIHRQQPTALVRRSGYAEDCKSSGDLMRTGARPDAALLRRVQRIEKTAVRLLHAAALHWIRSDAQVICGCLAGPSGPLRMQVEKYQAGIKCQLWDRAALGAAAHEGGRTVGTGEALFVSSE
jgi:hypothetical protein